MIRGLTPLAGRKISTRIASCLLFLALSALGGFQAWAQQVMMTISKGAPSDPLNAPRYVAFDAQGNLFISDTGNSRVRRLDKATGLVTTVVGTGSAGYSGDGCPALNAQINCPKALAVDSAGSLYIADACDNRVRKVAPCSDGLLKGDGETVEIITTYAGNGNVAPATDGALTVS